MASGRLGNRCGRFLVGRGRSVRALTTRPDRLENPGNARPSRKGPPGSLRKPCKYRQGGLDGSSSLATRLARRKHPSRKRCYKRRDEPLFRNRGRARSRPGVRCVREDRLRERSGVRSSCRPRQDVGAPRPRVEQGPAIPPSHADVRPNASHVASMQRVPAPDGTSNRHASSSRRRRGCRAPWVSTTRAW